MKEEWLFSGAYVPADAETTAALVAEIKRLIDVVGGMALTQRPWVGLTMDDINQFETWFDDEEERKGWVDPALIAKYFDAKIKDKNT